MTAIDMTLNDGILHLQGEINFANVMSVYRKSMQILQHVDCWQFDFAKVNQTNSATLALIIEWIKFANRNKKNIKLHTLPNDLLNIAKVSGLEKLLANYSA